MSQTIGEILALVAAMCGAASSILYNKLGKKTGSDILAYMRMVIAMPIMCIYALLVEGFAISCADLNSIVSLTISGIIGFFITDLFMFRAYVDWGARETMVVMCLAPVLSGIFAFLFFNESLSTKQLIGSLCSVLGIVIMVLGDKENGKAKLTKGAIYAFLAALLQSVADMYAKSALISMPWATSSALRAVGGLFAWIIFGFIKRKTFFENADTVKEPTFLLILIITVLIGTVTGTTVAMGALKFAPAGIVTSLKQISPIFILPYETFVLKKKLTIFAVVGTIVSVFGVFLIF